MPSNVQPAASIHTPVNAIYFLAPSQQYTSETKGKQLGTLLPKNKRLSFLSAKQKIATKSIEARPQVRLSNQLLDQAILFSKIGISNSSKRRRLSCLQPEYQSNFFQSRTKEHPTEKLFFYAHWVLQDYL